MNGHVVFDERLDVLASLEHCVMSLSQVRVSKFEWKWVILSLHSAFQGAMVCHLSGPKLLGAWRNKQDAEEYREWRERNKDRSVWYEGNRLRKCKRIQDDFGEYLFPRMDIASAAELFERLNSLEKRIEKTGVGGVISISTQQKESFEQFNFLRNNLTHFSPHIWGITLDYILDPMKDVLDVFDMILGDPHPFRPNGEKVLLPKIEKIRSLLKEVVQSR